MKTAPSRRSSLFLLELMIAILFFCLCSAVCVRLFVQSHIISEDTQNLSMAMNQTSSFAEIYRTEDDYLSVLKEQFSHGIIDNKTNTFTVFYNTDWAMCEPADGIYAVSLTTNTDSDQMSHAELMAVHISGSASDDSAADVLYQFETMKYVGGVDDES
ncbi:MAG: hypothetical protein PHW34_11875 [Hespellia sp.]|nr:hypothetical protein [Hespellia sp.]